MFDRWTADSDFVQQDADHAAQATPQGCGQCEDLDACRESGCVKILDHEGDDAHA